MVAVLVSGNKVHFEPVTVGRDYGTDIEITGGLKEGDRVIINPSDEVREGAEVRPASAKQKAAGTAGKFEFSRGRGTRFRADHRIALLPETVHRSRPRALANRARRSSGPCSIPLYVQE